MSPTRSTSTSIDIGSCAASDTIVANTGSSVYELLVRRSDCGDVLVRGGDHFPDFCPVEFLGSISNDHAVERHMIDIGLRMAFCFDNRIIVTSKVESLLRRPASDAKAACATPQ